MQNLADQTMTHEYAAAQAEYGGMYHDGDLLVVLFTADLNRHEAALRVRLGDPDQVAVLPTDRTWAELTAANARVGQLLMGPDTATRQVHGVGIGRHGAGFAIVVSADPGPLDIKSIAQAAAPEPVVVQIRQRPRLLSADTPAVTSA